MSRKTVKLLGMTNSNPVVVEYSIYWAEQNARKIGTFEIPRDEWNAMTPAERRARCEKQADEIFEDEVTFGWHIPDENDWAATEEQP